MRKTFPPKLELDDQVSRFLKRVGQLENPMNYVVAYSVDRDQETFTRITVTLLPDDEFSKVSEEEKADG